MSTWMVVEDEPSIYEVLLALFQLWSIDGTAFVDGDQAIAWIEDVDAGRYSGELPELALIDIRLPTSLWGHHVAARLRQSPVLRGVAIVLTTAYDFPKDELDEILRIADPDDLIRKPLPAFSELRPRLELIVRKRRAIHEAWLGANGLASAPATGDETQPVWEGAAAAALEETPTSSGSRPAPLPPLTLPEVNFDHDDDDLDSAVTMADALSFTEDTDPEPPTTPTPPPTPKRRKPR